MLPVSTIVRRIRMRLHDLDNITYSDEGILDALNMALRFVRRCIADIRPSLLIETHEGMIEAGTRSIELPFRPLKVLHITVGDNIIKSETIDNSESVFQNYKDPWHNPTPIYTLKQVDTYREAGLNQTELAHVVKDDNDITGEPKEFYITGSKTIHFVPIPERKIKYSIMYVPDFEELTIEDKSPLLTDFDDFLVEYASIRLNISNEFDMTQEQAMMNSIYQQIQKMLVAPPVGFVANGYWQRRRSRRSDYGL